MGKKAEPEKKELNQPTAISKEPVTNGEISSKKTDPNITEKKEKEKPLKIAKVKKKKKKRK